ncbi:DUF58 domain-containing protein [Jeotgalibaca sp. A127]|uniref:DUF58 domain-containing protein n=1 Tax=Jeotgalibaca sp. A127 TaxID=3457324 RepID=UPI003FD5E91F
MVYRRMAKQIAILLGFFILFIYTMAFPGTTSWFILLFFSLVVVVLWLSTLIVWQRVEADVNRLRLVAVWPLFLPDLKIRVENMETQMSALLSRRFDLAMKLPRGHYDTLTVETAGDDYFGFFRHRVLKRVPVNLDVYPDIVPIHKLSHHPEIRRYLKLSAPEIRQIRDYLPQDPLKHVDWKASFRREKLMVKEFEKEVEPRLHLVFIGFQTPRFEQLLALSYSAKKEWEEQLVVRVDLIGGDSFLTIQPSWDKAALLAQWQQLDLKHGKAIVFVPEALVDELRLSRHEPFMMVTEAGEAR